MAKGKLRADWNQTSHLLALLFNIHRDHKKSQAVDPQQINPYAKQQADNQKPDFYITAGQFAQLITRRPES